MKLNDKEKIELQKLDPRGFSARHRHSKSVESRSTFRTTFGANFPKPSGEEAHSLTQSPDTASRAKKKIVRTLSFHKALKEAKPVAIGSVNRSTAAN